MAEPFLGQISIFAGNFAPRNYALCAGQTLAISQNSALFSLLGTFYGGNGTTTFNLPDLRSRTPVHQGQGSGLSIYVVGEEVGVEQVTLLQTQMPSHTHTAQAGKLGTTDSPAGALPSTDPAGNVAQYITGAANATMNPAAIQPAGSNIPHNNIQPCLTVNFIIALNGVYPTRN